MAVPRSFPRASFSMEELSLAAKARPEVLGKLEEADSNERASTAWWAGTLFGDDLVGAPEAMARARVRLEEVEWLWAIREPQLLAELLRPPRRRAPVRSRLRTGGASGTARGERRPSGAGPE